MRCLFVWLVSFLLSAATASETDLRSQNLKHWRHVKKLGQHDPPVTATPQSPASTLWKGQEYENDGGKADLRSGEDGEGEFAVAAHLARADSDVDTAGQHGLDHRSVFVHVPVLECHCTEYSNIDIGISSCKEQGQVDFTVLVWGLVPGLVYELEWSLEGERIVDSDKKLLRYGSKSVVAAETDSYTLRGVLYGLSHGHPRVDIRNDGFFIEVTVRDMFPGLTIEEAVIGMRKFDSHTINALECFVHTSLSGECACKFSNAASISTDRELVGDASSDASTCRRLARMMATCPMNRRFSANETLPFADFISTILDKLSLVEAHKWPFDFVVENFLHFCGEDY
jgi:hypothetical protein